MHFPLLLTTLPLLAGCAFSQQHATTATPFRVPHVLVIGIDGVRTDALLAANTPVMDGLMRKGAVTLDAFAGGGEIASDPTQQATSSGPGWSSILTGVWVDKHGVDSNGAFASGNFGTYPHMFARIRSEMPDAYLASVVQWHPINQNLLLPYPGLADHTAQVANLGTAVRDEAASVIAGSDPTVLFVHFDDVDHAGHGSGFSLSNAAYRTAIEETDANIGAMKQAIEARPGAHREDWLVLITTDHGGTGTSHGGQSPGERRIWMIASGGEVVNETLSPGPGHQVIPATVFRHLGIEVDPAWGLDPVAPFGFRQEIASWPNPQVGTIGLAQNVALEWVGGEGAHTHQVLVGTFPFLGPSNLVATTADSSWSLTGLTQDTQYFWRIDTLTANGLAQGDVWSFTTAGDLLEGQVVHLPFESNAVNAVGGTPDGVLLGSPTFGAGFDQLALHLNALGDGVNLAQPAALQFGASTDFTVSLWVQASGWSGDPVFASNKNWVSGANTGWIIAADPNGTGWQWNFTGAQGSRVDFDAIAPIADGAWHHICVVHDRSGLASFYTDGVLNGTRSIAGQGDIDSGLPVALGQDGTLSYQLALTANLDELRVWRRALGASEVARIAADDIP